MNKRAWCETKLEIYGLLKTSLLNPVNQVYSRFTDLDGFYPDPTFENKNRIRILPEFYLIALTFFYFASTFYVDFNTCAQTGSESDHILTLGSVLIRNRAILN